MEFQLNCACGAPNPNSASSSTEKAANYALKAVGRKNITLKEKQLVILKLAVFDKKDVLAVLPAGFGKFLVNLFMPTGKPWWRANKFLN